MDVPTILGLVATAGLGLFYLPQLWTAYRAPVMTGFNIPAWIALWVAVVALVAQGAMLGIWTAVSANAIGGIALLYIIMQIRRKRPPADREPEPVIRSIPPRSPQPAWLPGDPVVDVCPLCEVPRDTWRDPARCLSYTRAPLARDGQSYRVCAACNADCDGDTDDEGTLACGQCGELYAAATWLPGDYCFECEDGVLRAPEEPVRKTIQGWAEADGFVVLDPDGFDRKDPHLMTRLFTREEWDRGWPRCTVGPRRK